MKALAEIRSTFSAEQCRRSEAEQSLMRAQLRLVASAPPVPERAASGSVEPASEDVAVLKAQLTKLTKSRNNAKQQAEKFLNQVKDAQSKAHEYQEKKADAFRNAQRYQEERTAAQKEAQGFKKALVDAQKELMELKAQNDQLYVQLSHEKRQAVQKETQASKKALIEAQKQLAELKAQNDQLQVQLSAASAPTNPTTSSPPRDPTEVALQFLPHYYTILSRTPKKMHQLYKADSVMSCGRSGENLQPAQGGAEIQKLTNTHLGFFKGSDPQYYSVDSQGSADGSIFVQVLGTTANQGGTKRWKFSQSFLLCRQEDGYYVRNDVMRYGEEGSVKVEE
ncbi:hypothetical protein DL96DRAFT_1535726 [Flagelloscypha sp. PMI_526]|nr:hypothetical protein DL96DRAFT_1535726 [Flagelloscypha sp. PMI_526]